MWMNIYIHEEEEEKPKKAEEETEKKSVDGEAKRFCPTLLSTVASRLLNAPHISRLKEWTRRITTTIRRPVAVSAQCEKEFREFLLPSSQAR